MINYFKFTTELNKMLLVVKSLTAVNKEDGIWKLSKGNLIYKANEYILLIYSIYSSRSGISIDERWLWVDTRKGVISFEEALNSCPSLAFDLDIFLSLDKKTQEIKEKCQM